MTHYETYLLERRASRLMQAVASQPIDVAVLMVDTHRPVQWVPPHGPRLLDTMTLERYLSTRAEDAILKSLRLEPAVMERGG